MKKYDFAVTVTGAAGFVGSHLCREFLEMEHDVRVMATDMYNVDVSRIVDLMDHDDFSYEPYNAHQPLHSDFLAVDTFYHLAGVADPKVYLEDPKRILDLNVDSIRNVCDRIVHWGAHRPRIVYTSTSEVYGKNNDVPFDEEESLLVFGPTQQPRWSYAMTKAVGEHYLRAYKREGIDHTIFRLFNVVGGDIDKVGSGRVLTQMFGSAMETGEIKVVLPGTQTRCFTWIDDVIDLLVRPTLYKKVPHVGSFDPSQSQTVNAGNDVEMTMGELGSLMRHLLAERTKRTIYIDYVEPEEVYGSKPYDDMMRRQPSVRRAEEIFGWHATMEPQDIVKTFLDQALRAHGGSREVIR